MGAKKELSNTTCSMYRSQRMCWIRITKNAYKPNEKVKAVQKKEKKKTQILYHNNDRHRPKQQVIWTLTLLFWLVAPSSSVWSCSDEDDKGVWNLLTMRFTARTCSKQFNCSLDLVATGQVDGASMLYLIVFFFLLLSFSDKKYICLAYSGHHPKPKVKLLTMQNN